MRKTRNKYLCLLLALCMMLLPVAAYADVQAEPAAVQEETAVAAAEEPAAQEETADVTAEEPAAQEEAADPEAVVSEETPELADTEPAAETEEIGEEESTGEIPESTEVPAATEEELPAAEEGVPVEDGFHEIDGKLYYFLSDKAQTGLLELTGEDGTTGKYYFAGDGAAVVGPARVEDTLYFFGADHKAYTGGCLSYTLEGAQAVSFFGADGAAYNKGYKETNGVATADEAGVITPAADTNRYRYYFCNDGLAYNQGLLEFVHTNGKTYYFYFQEDGKAFTGGYKSAAYGKVARDGVVTDGTETGKARYFFQFDGKGFNKGVLSFLHTDGKTYTFYFQANARAYTGGYKKSARYYTCSDVTAAPVAVDIVTAHQYYFQANANAFNKGVLCFVHTNGKTYTMSFQSNGQAREKVGYLRTTSFYKAGADCNPKAQAVKDYYFWFKQDHFAYNGGFLRFVHTNGKTYNFYFLADGTADQDIDRAVKKRYTADAAGNLKNISTEDVYGYYFAMNGHGSLFSGWHKTNDVWSWYNSDGIREFRSDNMYTAWSKIKSKSSPTRYYIVVDCKNCECYTFTGSAGKWTPKFLWKCSPGKPSTPTVKGTYSVKAKGYYFNSGTSLTCYYYTQFYGNYLFHSVPYYYGTWKLKYPTLGKQLSHGCVRLATENAKWYYDNMPSGTKVYIY